MYLLTVCVTVAVVTVMFKRLLSMAAPIGVINCNCKALSMGTVFKVAVLIMRPVWESIRPSVTASSNDNSRFLSAL